MSYHLVKQTNHENVKQQLANPSSDVENMEELISLIKDTTEKRLHTKLPKQDKAVIGLPKKFLKRYKQN